MCYSAAFPRPLCAARPVPCWSCQGGSTRRCRRGTRNLAQGWESDQSPGAQDLRVVRHGRVSWAKRSARQCGAYRRGEPRLRRAARVLARAGSGPHGEHPGAPGDRPRDVHGLGRVGSAPRRRLASGRAGGGRRRDLRRTGRRARAAPHSSSRCEHASRVSRSRPSGRLCVSPRLVTGAAAGSARISSSKSTLPSHRRSTIPEPSPLGSESGPIQGVCEADARTRTGDPFITSEVLYQLSYVGGRGHRTPSAHDLGSLDGACAGPSPPARARDGGTAGARGRGGRGRSPRAAGGRRRSCRPTARPVSRLWWRPRPDRRASRIAPCPAGRRSSACKGRTMTTRVIDRGPYVAGRTFDLTGPAASRLVPETTWRASSGGGVTISPNTQGF